MLHLQHVTGTFSRAVCVGLGYLDWQAGSGCRKLCCLYILQLKMGRMRQHPQDLCRRANHCWQESDKRRTNFGILQLVYWLQHRNGRTPPKRPEYLRGIIAREGLSSTCSISARVKSNAFQPLAFAHVEIYTCWIYAGVWHICHENERPATPMFCVFKPKWCVEILHKGHSKVVDGVLRLLRHPGI